MTQPIILAAGGTGGHIFPAEALAEELDSRGHSVVLITDRRFRDYYSDTYRGVIGRLPVHFIHAAGGRGTLLQKLRGGYDIALGIRQARQLLKELRPRAVVGFGGYPSFPTMLAASFLSLDTVIHEQNSVLGRANRALVHRMRRIAATYDPMQKLPATCRSKLVLTGNPVRAAVRALTQIPYAPPQQDGALRLLITGGSQGAQIFSDVVPEAVRLLPPPLRARLRIDQQCRADAVEATREAYRGLNVAADVAPFFNDLAARLASAHLVIARAGASTVAELTCAGRPAMLVPYPQAADNHQYYNAQAVEDAQGGWLLPQEGFSAPALSARLESLLNLPQALADAAARMRRLGKPDAAARLADAVLGSGF